MEREESSQERRSFSMASHNTKIDRGIRVGVDDNI